MNHVFLTGEKIDLCIPVDEDFEKWANWFNDQQITRFLEQGKFPNTIKQQRDFYHHAVESGRFLTLIKTKDSELLGVISLSEINHDKRSCQIAYVCPEKSEKAPLAPLEALAICTQHAFLRLGIERVWAGHAYPGLHKWIHKTELVGFKTDGIFPNEFQHGIVTSDSARTSITKRRFLELINRRQGNLWPGEKRAKKMLLAIKQRESLAEKVDKSIKSLHAAHDLFLERLEHDCE